MDSSFINGKVLNVTKEEEKKTGSGDGLMQSGWMGGETGRLTGFLNIFLHKVSRFREKKTTVNIILLICDVLNRKKGRTVVYSCTTCKNKGKL